MSETMSDNYPWTAGPWLVFAKNGVVAVVKRGRSIVAWDGFDASDYSLSTQISNANLIAAAPDLAEALADLRDRFRNAALAAGNEPEYVDIACQKADAALARARGEETNNG